MAGVAVLATVGCVTLGDFTEKHYGKKDPSHCTLDEWAGQAVALMFLPCSQNLCTTLCLVGAAFLSFRVFDIIKPAPARNFERFSKGVGVVADDLVAGLYACVTVQVLLWAAVDMLKLRLSCPFA
jgi:phosphatidylglycerophosphatase A